MGRAGSRSARSASPAGSRASPSGTARSPSSRAARPSCSGRRTGGGRLLPAVPAAGRGRGRRPPPGTARAVAEQSRAIARHAAADRTVGVLLVRLGGYAAGVFTGSPPRLAASKVGSRLVHGRSAAGGQSQQRFARRREKQAAEALGAAADTAARVFGGYPGTLDAVVLGGDRRAVAGLRDDPRLAGVLRPGDRPVPDRARPPAARCCRTPRGCSAPSASSSPGPSGRSRAAR